MTPQADPLHDVRVADVLTFLSVRRYGSLTAAARELKVTPSQVSKAINRLERQLNRTLLARSSKGVALSDVAERVVPQLEAMVAQLRGIRRNPDEAPARELTIAAPSYLMSAFLPALAGALPLLRLRGLQLAPAVIRASASQNLFDLAITIGEEKLTDAWQCDRVGLVQKALFATPAMARRLGPKVKQEDLREVPFVSPVYSFNGQFVPVDDGCPLPYGERRLGHEAQTIGIALELAACSDQLVFGPVLAARGHLDRAQLVEVKVDRWQLSDALLLCTNVDRVAASVQKTVLQTLRSTLAELG